MSRWVFLTIAEFKDPVVTVPRGSRGSAVRSACPRWGQLQLAASYPNPVFMAGVVNMAPAVCLCAWWCIQSWTGKLGLLPDATWDPVSCRGCVGWGAAATAIPLGCTRKASLGIVFFFL